MALRCRLAPPPPFLFSCTLSERHSSLTCGLLFLRRSVFLFFFFGFQNVFFLLIFRLDPVLDLLLWSITEVGQRWTDVIWTKGLKNNPNSYHLTSKYLMHIRAAK